MGLREHESGAVHEGAELEVFMACVRLDLMNRKFHAYWNFWIVYGKRPMSAASSYVDVAAE